MASDTHPLKIANDSGFPLQIAIENLVRNNTSSHGWTVRYSEHSWLNTFDQSHGFIDIVLQDRSGTIFLVVECKRKVATWVFMQANGTGAAHPKRHANAWLSHSSGEQFKNFGWTDIAPDPACPEATFCAVRGEAANQKVTMLENIGSTLVSSTEALAQEDRIHRQVGQETLRFYFNVVVTTADLQIVKFNPDEISLSTGTLENAQVEDVPFIRFRKQLSTRESFLSPKFQTDKRELAYMKEKTIFVVKATELDGFLRRFKVSEENISYAKKKS